MSKEKRRVPKLRFPGFTEDWEQRKLTDIAKTFIGLVTTMTENYRDSGTLLIRNSDIKEGQFIFSEKPIHLDEEFAEKNKTRRLQIGDVVTVHTGDIGTSAVIKEKEAGAIGFATINTRTDKRILNPYFLSTYFNTDKHKCYANSVSTGDGRSNYNIKDFNKLVISIPTLDEQEKISAIINNINTIITLHQRKLDNLKLKKKALLQKLFPKNGERYPELRFPGFTDAWEQRKLNEFLSVSNLKNTENKYNKKNVLSVSGDYGIVNQIEFQGRSFAGASVSNYGVVEKGDIVYTKSPLKLNPYGIIKTNRINNGIVSTLYAIYKTKENCDSKFIEHYFNLDSRLNQYLKPLVNKGAKNDMKVSSENALVGEICFPQITEQAMIADLLDRLDIYITLHQRKLDHLQLQKKALLQQMFV